MFHGFILGMDTFALGLIKAAEIIEDGRINAFVEERYASYHEGIGKKIVEGNVKLEELVAYAEAMGAPKLPSSGSQEKLQIKEMSLEEGKCCILELILEHLL